MLKGNGEDTRLIFHLSYPRKGNKSVNACTPHHLCRVTYKDLPYAIKLCMEAGPGCFAAKADMKSAFRNMPIRPQDWMLLVTKAKHPRTGETFYFIDKCLPVGASISCSHFQRFSNCVAFLCFKRTGKRTNNYVDDFFFTALLEAMCNGQVYEFLKIRDEIRFPVAPEKTVWGMTIIIFLGILINTETQTILRNTLLRNVSRH